MHRAQDSHNGLTKESDLSVEEATDCRDSNMRYFAFTNRKTNIVVTISKSTTFSSCQLNGQEIVLDQRHIKQKHETWAISERPLYKMNTQTWSPNCHVRGLELYLSGSSGSSIVCELDKHNEFRMLVKLKSPHYQQPVIYFNLKNARQKLPIDGHTLSIQCSGSMNKLQVQNTQLLCQCNSKSSIIPKSLIGDVPFELVQNNLQQTATNSNEPLEEDDIIITDAIFSLESTNNNDYVSAQLQYANRGVQVEVRPALTASSIHQQHQQSQPQQTTTLRLRVRITNFGICIMPVMMSNYNVLYKFYF